MRHLSFAAFSTLALVGCVEPGLDTTRQAVIGGAPTATGMYPSVGALYDTTQQSFFCTGTLIAPDAVLTAGHCLEPGAPAPSFTFDHDTRGAVTAVAGASFAIHPMFDLDRAIGDGPTQYYDLAVLKLAQPVTGVRPMVLASPAEAAGLVAGKMLTLIGYGQTVDGNPGSGGVKFDGAAPVVRTSASEIQIGTPGQIQNCYGDSGGPAFTDLGAGVRTVGVVSRGATASPQCNTGGVDTRVDYYLAWIRQQAPGVCVGGEACASGTTNPPGEDPPGEDPPGEDPLDEDGGSDTITGGCSTGGGGSGGAAFALVALGLIVARRRRG